LWFDVVVGEEGGVDMIDDIKLQFLKEKLKEDKIKNPSRKDIERILGIGYSQAYNYLKALSDDSDV